MSEPSSPKTKYVLECVGLLVTIIGGVVGTVIALRSSAPPAPPATAQAEPQRAGDSRADQPLLRLASAALNTPNSAPRGPAPTVSTVDVAQIQDAAKLQALQQENTAKIATLLDSYVEQVTNTTATPIGYDANRQACLVDVAVTTDPRRYVEFLGQLEPFLQLDSQLVDKLSPPTQSVSPSAPLTVALLQERSGPKLAYSRTASADASSILDPIADLKPNRREETVPSAIVTVVPTANGTASAGDELNARVWRVTKPTGTAFFEMFTAAAENKLRVELADASGASLVTQTRPTALPHDGSWSANRFVLPAALLGDSMGLDRGQFVPMASQRSVQRRDSHGRRLLGLLPGFCSAPQRIDGERKTETPEFTGTVTYRLAIPMSAEDAGRIATATATRIR